MSTPPRNDLTWRSPALAGRVSMLLVRHGQTTWNKQRRFIGKSDVPLDETGHEQARTLGRWLADLPAQGLVSSPLSRARQTAEAILGEHPALQELRLEPDLAELDQGELEGQPAIELPTRWPDFFEAWLQDPTDARVPGGETLRECHERSWAALERLAADADVHHPLVVVSHKMVISTAICRILDLPLGYFRLIGQENTAVNLLSWGQDGARLHLLNGRDHLGG